MRRPPWPIGFNVFINLFADPQIRVHVGLNPDIGAVLRLGLERDIEMNTQLSRPELLEQSAAVDLHQQSGSTCQEDGATNSRN